MLKERLKLARKNAHKSQAEVAEAVGITQSAYSQLETGRVESSTALPQIARLLGVDAYWLQTGDGDAHTPIKNGVSTDATPIDVWEDGTPVDPDEVEIVYYKDFRLSCGSGSIIGANSNEAGRLRIKRSTLDRRGIYKDKTFATTAKDNSMFPEIKDGDTVYVDQDRNYIKDGKIFAIEHGGLFRCKRLYTMPNGGVRIVSDNKDEYPEEVLTIEQMNEQDFCIIGWIFKVDRLNDW